MAFWSNVSGAQKIGLILVVLLVAVRIVFPDVAQWAFDGIREMTQSVIELLNIGESE